MYRMRWLTCFLWKMTGSDLFKPAGQGYAQFDFDPSSMSFTADPAGTPTRDNACHTVVKSKDYVFHPYQMR